MTNNFHSEPQETRDEATFQKLWNLVSSLVDYSSKYDENFDRDIIKTERFIKSFKHHFDKLELKVTKEKVKSQFLEDVNLGAHLLVYDIPDEKYQITKRYNELKELILPDLSVIFKDEYIFLKRFENKFNDMPEKQVYDYFKDNLVNSGLLKQNQTERYLTSAFQNCKPPIEKFKFSKEITKENIGLIFYRFYIANNESLLKTKRSKNDFIKLVEDYFEGFENIKSSFRLKEKHKKHNKNV